MNKKPQVLGWQGLSLLVPSVMSAIGFFCFAVMAFSFTELNTLPQWFRTSLVLVGSFTLAFGSEIGTLSNVVEVYRKGQNKQTWDWVALLISVTSTIGSFVLAFATLLGVSATWGSVVKLYGPIVLGVLAALDSYGNFLEFGLYLSTYDKRLREWEEKQSQDVEKSQSDNAITIKDIEKIVRGLLEKQTTLAEISNVSLEKEQRLERLLNLYAENSTLPVKDASEMLGVSNTTVYGYLNELEQAGKIHKNGQGVEVLEGAL